MPGLPSFPGQAPAPGKPSQPQPQQGNCPQGQAPDLMSGQCSKVCAGGTPSVGGMCLPIPGR
jgi:hypothetical protein